MKNTKDIYQQVTEKIISSLKEGVGPWIKPWNDSDISFGLHRNGFSDRPYRGVNVLLLNLVAFEKGYTDPRWVTFHDVQQLKGHIRKGEKHTKIVFWKFLEVKENKEQKEEQPDNKKKIIPIVRVHRVFNVEQCENLKLSALTTPPGDTSDAELNNMAEEILSLPLIKHGGNRAAFYPTHDFIQLPPKISFENIDHYYATGFHEVIHWTGHKSRLEREFGKRFGDRKYAFEELVAEIGSAFLGGHANLPFKEMRHPEYIKSWIKTLEEDNRAIFTACRHSQTAADFVCDQLKQKKLKTA